MRNTIRLVTVLLACCQLSAANKRPNILFIMSDDHTAQAVGAYATVLKELDPTPTIDTLAAEGITFDNAFCVNAICTPSRACIITGQYPHVNGVFDLGGRIKPENQTLPILFRDAGYQTAMIGKWHLKEEPNFDYYKVLPGQGKFFNTQFRIQGDKKWPLNTVTHEGEHSSDCITDSTLEWFKNKRDPNKPFFVCHQYKAPHDYFENAERYQTYLADVHIPEVPTLYDVPETFGSIATRGHNDELMPHIGTSIGKRNPRRSYAVNLFKKFPEEFPSYYDYEKMSEPETTRLAYQAYLKKYLRCVKGVDDNLKRLFNYLKKEGLYDNTVIIYTGDQGFWLGENDYQDKRWAYDPSMRMPFIVRYPPTIKAGIRSDAIVENVDYPALMLDFADIDRPKSMQGRSFKSICETGKEPKNWKQAAYYRYWMHMAHHDNPGEMAIRTKTHKLIYFYGANYKGQNQTPPAWELYDLRKDPQELNNVYDDPAYVKIRDRLKKQFASLRQKIGDDGSHHPECEKIVQEFWDYDEADRQKAIRISHDFKATREASLNKRSAPPKKDKVSGRVTKDKGGWILPARSKAPLRKHNGLTEVSRNAVYKISHPGNPSFNVDNAHLLSGTAPQVKQHAFHTPEVDRPYVIIKLDKPAQIGHVRIVNRTGTRELQARAADLTLSLSQDGKGWKQVWQAESIQPVWNAAADATARYLKLGLPRKGTLHLNQVIVFEKQR